LGGTIRTEGAGEQRHRRKVAQRIDLSVRQRRDIHRQRLRGEQQRVAIVPGLGDGNRGDIAARARFVLDHHRLMPALAKLLPEQARENVGRSADAEGDDDAHAAFGKRRLRQRGRCLKRQQRRDDHRVILRSELHRRI
jgi:hypothetical protein